MKKWLLLSVLWLPIVHAKAQRVGVGTSSLRAALQVEHSSDGTSPMLHLIDSSTGSVGRYIQLRQAGNNTYWQINTEQSFGAISASYSSAASPALLLESGGNMGIQVANAQSALHVNSPVTASAQFNGSTSGAYITFSENDTARGYFGSVAGNQADIDFGTVAGNLTGRVHLLNRGQTRLTVAANGQVGIGTLAPQQSLSVANGLQVDFGNNFESQADFNPALQIGRGAFIASGRGNASTYQFALQFFTDSTSRFFLRAEEGLAYVAGFVPFGVHVPGDIRAADTVYFTNGGYLPQLYSGRVLVGNSNNDSKELDVSFGNNFPQVPIVTLMVEQEPYTLSPVNDLFVASTVSVSTTGMRIKVSRIDSGRPGNGWGQSLHLSWMATVSQ